MTEKRLRELEELVRISGGRVGVSGAVLREACAEIRRLQSEIRRAMRLLHDDLPELGMTALAKLAGLSTWTDAVSNAKGAPPKARRKARAR